MPDFTTTTTLHAPPEAVHQAVLDPRSWWNRDIEGPTREPGDEFGFDVVGLHRTRMRVTAVSPGHRVEWTVLENEFGFVDSEDEWVGDRLTFELEPTAGGATELRFTQHGLEPHLECYDVCRDAWTFFVGVSLRDLVEHGRGAPESAAADAPDVPRDDFLAGSRPA